VTDTDRPPPIDDPSAGGSAPDAASTSLAGEPLSHVAHSTSMELMVETVFLAEVLQEAWFVRRQLVDVMHSSVDAFGYDLVLQCGDVTRHVQLKAKRTGGSTSTYAINTLLTERPAGCVVCIEWRPHPDTHRLELSYRWLGNGPFERLHDLGDKISKHSRGNAKGQKGERPAMRDVKLTSFAKLASTSELVDRLFGPATIAATRPS